MSYNNVMTDLQKAFLTTDGNHVDITVPFTKANQEKRTIIGIATADAVDHAGDVVTWTASKRAFETTSAAIREQHQKDKTVGKIIGFEAKSLWDDNLQKVVNVIEVEAYISRTAEDTWTKINEGILKGFSIGGNVTQSEERISKDDPTKSHRYITDYTLTELSVVDNPCSPQAQIMSIVKSADGEDIMKGMATEVDTENVWWNPESRELKVTKDEQVAGYENIGWIETSKSLDDDARSEQLALVLKTYQDLNKSDEGGVTNMSEQEVTEGTVEEVQAPATEVTEVVETPSEEVTEETVEVEEVPAEDNDLKKMLDELRETITNTFTKAIQDSSDQNKDAFKSFTDEFEKAAGAVAAVSAKNEELSKSVEELTAKFGSIEKSIESLEADTAIKKSSDLGGSTEIRKNRNVWEGTSLSLSDL
jgi:hypothetical protein